MRVRALGALFLLANLSLACSPDQREEAGETWPREDVARQIQDLYDQARETGERVPADAYEWARSDLEGIGDWEYQVLRLDDAGDAEVETRLDELGRERWEVFWLETTGSQLRVFLKRPRRSYLRHLPLSELRRLLPGSSSAE